MGGESSSTLWSESEAAARGRRTRRVMAADTAPAAEAIAGWNGRPARSGGRLSVFLAVFGGVRVRRKGKEGGQLHGRQGKPEVFEERCNTLSRLQAAGRPSDLLFFNFYLHQSSFGCQITWLNSHLIFEERKYQCLKLIILKVFVTPVS